MALEEHLTLRPSLPGLLVALKPKPTSIRASHMFCAATLIRVGPPPFWATFLEVSLSLSLFLEQP